MQPDCRGTLACMIRYQTPLSLNHVTDTSQIYIEYLEEAISLFT